MFYLEVYISVFIHVESTKHVVAELDGIAGWEKHFVHVDELCWGQPAVGAVLL